MRIIEYRWWVKLPISKLRWLLED